MAESDSPAGVLSIEDLSAGYGKAAVISEIDLSLQPGEFFGLIGLNGAGKTTLIKTILGLRRALAGGIHIMGRPYDSGEARRALAYLPENFQPPWFLTGIEFLRFSLKLHNQKKADADLRESAQRLALDPAVLDRRVQTYSKGMRQKLGLLGTVLVECPLLILDEPMSGLDPRARTLVKELLLAKKRKGCAVFLSSHILADMDEICDRIGVLHGGRLRFTGAPSALKVQTGQESLEKSFLHFIEVD